MAGLAAAAPWLAGGLAIGHALDLFADGGDVQGRKDMTQGGDVHGPGTETSDSIPAWLSKGEYVINADAVKLVGKDKLEKINDKGLEKRYGNDKPGLKRGAPALASGGYLGVAMGAGVEEWNRQQQMAESKRRHDESMAMQQEQFGWQRDERARQRQTRDRAQQVYNDYRKGQQALADLSNPENAAYVAQALKQYGYGDYSVNNGQLGRIVQDAQQGASRFEPANMDALRRQIDTDYLSQLAGVDPMQFGQHLRGEREWGYKLGRDAVKDDQFGREIGVKEEANRITDAHRQGALALQGRELEMRAPLIQAQAAHYGQRGTGGTRGDMTEEQYGVLNQALSLEEEAKQLAKVDPQRAQALRMEALKVVGSLPQKVQFGLRNKLGAAPQVVDPWEQLVQVETEGPMGVYKIAVPRREADPDGYARHQAAQVAQQQRQFLATAGDRNTAVGEIVRNAMAQLPPADAEAFAISVGVTPQEYRAYNLMVRQQEQANAQQMQIARRGLPVPPSSTNMNAATTMPFLTGR